MIAFMTGRPLSIYLPPECNCVWCNVLVLFRQTSGVSNISNSKSILHRLDSVTKIENLQECIPVGCVPSAAVAARGEGVWRGIVCLGDWSAQGDLCQGVICLGGVCPRGCLPMGECVCLGGVCLTQGVCLPRGCIPLLTEWQTHVKTLLCHNYVVDGKNDRSVKTLIL